jgi:RNA polymerase sigma factor (sigma-70 family)
MSAENRTTKNPNRQEIGDLIEEHQPRLKSFIRKRVASREDADDILQDVFYQMVKYFDEAVSPIVEVSSWLYEVAQNNIINKYKKKKELSLPEFQDSEFDDAFFGEFSEILLGTDESSSPEMEYLRSMVWTELEEALSELPIEQREVFEKTELEGLSIKEISSATGIPANTLLSRKHYAVMHLRKRLSDLYLDIISK